MGCVLWVFWRRVTGLLDKHFWNFHFCSFHLGLWIDEFSAFLARIWWNEWQILLVIQAYILCMDAMHYVFNSLAPGRCIDFKNVIYKHMLWVASMWIPMNTFDDKSALIWVMAWCQILRVTQHLAMFSKCNRFDWYIYFFPTKWMVCSNIILVWIVWECNFCMCCD